MSSWQSEMTPEEWESTKMNRQEYEDRYGEKIIRCNIHGGYYIDSCDICEDEERVNIPKEEWVSECCESRPIGELDISEFGVTGFCGNCKDSVGFEPPW